MNSAVPRQLPPPGRRSLDLTNELLVQLIAHQLRFESTLMDQLAQLQASAASLTVAQADATAKVDVLLQKNDLLLDLAHDLERQLVALAEAGQLPSDALSDIITKIDAAKTAYNEIGTKVAAESDKVDAELAADAPVPSPTPEPAPEPSPAPGPSPAPSEPPVDSPAPAPAEGDGDAPSDPPVENGPETP